LAGRMIASMRFMNVSSRGHWLLGIGKDKRILLPMPNAQ